MELVLNLLWLTLAAVAFCKVWLQRRVQASTMRHSTVTALLAVSCILFLLFPIVSASDDLHGDQALAEDAIKRVSRSVSHLQQVKQAADTWTFLRLLSLLSVFFLVRLSVWGPLAVSTEPIGGHCLAKVGRAPPVLS